MRVQPETSGTTTYTYDPAGNVKEKDTPEGDLHYTYTAANQVASVATSQTPGGATITAASYEYDSLGRLVEVAVTTLNGQALPSNEAVDVLYFYDADGNLTHEIRQFGTNVNYLTQTIPQLFGLAVSLPSSLPSTGALSINYEYDALNRLTDVSVSNGSQTIYTAHYTLNADGTRAGAVETELQPGGGGVGASATINTSWGYDAMGRLISETVTSNLAAENYSSGYAYDLDGNRISEMTTNANGTATITSHYNAQDELVSQTSSQTGATTTYSYDANGSLTNDGTHQYFYDVRNRLMKVEDESNNVLATYTYDDAGDRVSETTYSGGVATTTYYLIDDENPTGYAKPIEVRTSTTGSIANSTLQTTYILGGTGVVGQVDSSGNISFLVQDGREDTRELTNVSGGVTATFNYNAFGNPIGFNPATAGTIWLVGDAMYDSPSGLEMHGSGRQSESANGIFIEANPPEDTDSQYPLTLNAYVMDDADPVNGDDPTGFYDQEFGYLAEAAIRDVYELQYPTNDVNPGTWSRLGPEGGVAYSLKPDILDNTRHTWAEIKPLTYGGTGKAAASYALYALAFAPFGYSPDISWKPMTHYTLAGATPIFFFNAGGIIFYTSETDLADELIGLTSLVAVRSFLLSEAGKALSRSVESVLEDEIPGLIDIAVGAAPASFDAELGGDALLSFL